ncbi:hypothetical protein Fmac_022307 [Flemingia macrophylla]|uniref:Ribosomal protein L32 n=1 Tax=Flemingia macrophylla TaxID=520843 RepID=A0ABD1M160_9FABA
MGRNFRRPPKVRMNIIKNTFGAVSCSGETNSFLFPKNAMLAKFQLTNAMFAKKTLFAQKVHAFFTHVA